MLEYWKGGVEEKVRSKRLRLRKVESEQRRREMVEWWIPPGGWRKSRQSGA